MGNNERNNYKYLDTFGYLNQRDEHGNGHHTRSSSRTRRELELYDADRIEQQDDLDFQQELEELNAGDSNEYSMASCGCPKKKKKSSKKSCGKKKPKKRKSKGSCGKKRKSKKSKGCKGKSKKKSKKGGKCPPKCGCSTKTCPPPNPCDKPKKKKRSKSKTKACGSKRKVCGSKPKVPAPKCSEGTAPPTNQERKFGGYNYLQQFQ